jgi:hypothetical protein
MARQQTPPAIVHDIESVYILPDPEAVLIFLRKNPGLSELLLQAYHKLNELFGPNPQIELALVSDPEDAELQQTLFGHIRTHLAVPEAIATPDKFDETWFLDAVRHVNSNLNFSLKFA